MKFTTIIQERLSTGELIYVERQGNKYMFGRTNPAWGEPPHAIHNLSKSAATDFFSNALKADVLEQLDD